MPDLSADEFATLAGSRCRADWTLDVARSLNRHLADVIASGAVGLDIERPALLAKVQRLDLLRRLVLF